MQTLPSLPVCTPCMKNPITRCHFLHKDDRIDPHIQERRDKNSCSRNLLYVFDCTDTMLQFRTPAKEWKVVFNMWRYPSRVNNTVRMYTISIGHNLHGCYESSQSSFFCRTKTFTQNTEWKKTPTSEKVGAAGAFENEQLSIFFLFIFLYFNVRRLFCLVGIILWRRTRCAVSAVGTQTVRANARSKVTTLANMLEY